MVAKSELKLIRSLQQKKFRAKHSLFVVEGKKTLETLLSANFEARTIIATKDIVIEGAATAVQIISTKDFESLSSLKNPNGILGVFYIKDPKPIAYEDWIVGLDDIQDPGNLGTIIRLCDWFGIKELVCSLNTVDCYNPKVIQATMGSIANVNITYMALPVFLQETKLPVYGSFMNGKSVCKSELPAMGVLIMGNEGRGISTEIENFCIEKISIPQYGAASAESLNVATASAILFNEIRRG